MMVSCEYSDWYAANVEGEAENVIRKESLSEYQTRPGLTAAACFKFLPSKLWPMEQLACVLPKDLKRLRTSDYVLLNQDLYLRYSRMICIHIKP